MVPPPFPPEIHSIIIRFATYTPVYFDLPPDPRCLPIDGELWSGIPYDYATKKALTLVSRQFRHSSLPYLYEVVMVHNSSNMHLLANVLDMESSDTATSGQQNPRKIGYLFVCLLVGSRKGRLGMFKSLGRVLNRCGCLKGFGLKDTVPYWRDEPCDWWTSIPKDVHFVDWEAGINAGDFTRMIDSVSESLIALRFSKLTHDNTSQFVSLPKLTHLSIPEEHRGIEVLYNWNMPSLTRLCVNVTTGAALVRVVERAGTSLRSVFLGPGSSPAFLSQVATAAQNLEECTYHFRTGMEESWATVRSHPSLQSIVVVFRRRIRPPRNGVHSPMFTFFSHLQPLTEAHFPKLRRVGFVGFDPYSAFDTQIRARLDELLDAWNASGVEVKYLGS